MGILDWLKPRPALDAATRALVERAVDGVDPLIRQAGDYARRLVPAVRCAIDYCDDIARRIPGPVEVSRAAFAADPLVHALFGSADDIELMFARSQCVREHVMAMTAASGKCCALLGMRHREKAGYGVELAGGVVRSDVPQKTLYFTDHTLAEPSPDPDAARLRMRRLLFDSLLKGFAAHVADVRAERDSLYQARAFAHASVRSGSRPESHTRRLEALEEQLRATADALQPARLLDTLAAALTEPAPYLHLDPVYITVDRSGVIGSADQPGSGDTLHFAELTSRDQRRWVILLVLIERAEARRALDRLEQANRYIVI
jgi:hypothetical protein